MTDTTNNGAQDQDILAEMEADVVRVKQSSASQMFLYLKDGEKALVRPLLNLDRSIRLLKHEKYDSATGRTSPHAICAQSFKQECVWCAEAKASGDRKLTASPRYYLLVYVHGVYTYDATRRSWTQIYARDDITQLLQGVRVLELKVTSPILDLLRATYDDDPAHDISAHDFAIARNGKALDTKYTVVMQTTVRPLPADLVVPDREKLISDIEIAAPMKTVASALAVPHDNGNEFGEEFP